MKKRFFIPFFVVFILCLFSTIIYANENEARIGDTYYDTLGSAINSASDFDTIILLKDITIESMLDINKKNVILDLNGKTINSTDYFVGSGNKAHLIDITAFNVSIKNGYLAAGANNNHTLNIYNAKNVTIENVTIDGLNAGIGGAPLIVNASDVILKGNVNIITGKKSWYGINIDSRIIGGNAVGASVEFSNNSNINFSGLNPLGIYMENNANVDNEKVSLEFKENVRISSSIESFVSLYKSESAKESIIKNPGNAGLIEDENGMLIPHNHDYLDELKGDETNHWKECDCGEKTEVAAHTYKWVIDKEATNTEKGLKHQECSVCGYKLAKVEIPAVGNDTGTSSDITEENQNIENVITDNKVYKEKEQKILSPKTSDENNVLLWSCVLALALVGILVTNIYKGKRSFK